MFWPSFYSSARVDDDVILRVVSVLGHWVEFPLVLQLLEVEVAVGGGDLQNPIFLSLLREKGRCSEKIALFVLDAHIWLEGHEIALDNPALLMLCTVWTSVSRMNKTDKCVEASKDLGISDPPTKTRCSIFFAHESELEHSSILPLVYAWWAPWSAPVSLSVSRRTKLRSGPPLLQHRAVVFMIWRDSKKMRGIRVLPWWSILGSSPWLSRPINE